MAADDRTRVHWEAVKVAWSGFDYSVHVPAYIDAAPALWLGYELPKRVHVDQPHATVVVTAATKAMSGYDSAGTIVVGSLAPPFPSAGWLHGLISQAVDNAYAEADRAATEAEGYAQEFQSIK